MLHTTIYFPRLRFFTYISAPTFFNSVCVYTVSYSTAISTSVLDLIFHVCSISHPVSSAFNIFTCISAPTSLNYLNLYLHHLLPHCYLHLRIRFHLPRFLHLLLSQLCLHHLHLLYHQLLPATPICPPSLPGSPLSHLMFLHKLYQPLNL